VRLAFFSPLPPERSGIADYSFELLQELRELAEIDAVIRDDLLPKAEVPAGVNVVGLSRVGSTSFDCRIYQMGNNWRYHRSIYQEALDFPGVVVLHDPSLADFHSEIFGGGDRIPYREEAAYDAHEIKWPEDLPLVEVARGQTELDRLQLFLARRLVDASVRVLVHSQWIAHLFNERYNTRKVRKINLPTNVVETTQRPRATSGDVRFGVFGGIAYYKRVDAVVEAFQRVHREFPRTQMVIAGRCDDSKIKARLETIARLPEMHNSLTIKSDLSLDGLQREMEWCDVAVALRWPTAGEMSATLMRAFGTGRAAIVSDVPQFRELDGSFCWRVSTKPDVEAPELVRLMRLAALEPKRISAAGAAARAFVTKEATYKIVAKQYIAHVASCIAELSSAQRTNSSLTSWANRTVGVNVRTYGRSRSDLERASKRVAAAMRHRHSLLVSELGNPLTPSLEEGANTRKHVERGRQLVRWRMNPDTQPGAEERNPALSFLHVQGGVPSEEQMEPGDVELLFVDDSSVVSAANFCDAAHRRGKTAIAAFAPDLHLPSRIRRSLYESVDAIWTPSAYSADIIRSQSSVPVHVVPWPYSVARADSTTECASRSDKPAIRVVATFDARRSIERANPWSTVRAFRSAFSRSERTTIAQLVIVVRGLDVYSSACRMLADEVESVDGILVTNPHIRTYEAYVQTCDVFVSLHRAESFGLDLLDAFASGRSIIATAFGGNVEFLRGPSSSLVGYQMKATAALGRSLDDRSDYRSDLGLYWAEPDIAEASSYIRRVVLELRERGQTMPREEKHSEQYGERMVGNLILEQLRIARPLTSEQRESIRWSLVGSG
jgi:glycosyltransferase involved in cell wall biosynthesis